jgi:hypothetical protein
LNPRALVAVSCLAFTSLAFAEAPAAFESAKGKAEAVGGLGNFLESYIGDCDPVSGAECKANVQAYRQKMTGKKLYMMLSEDEARMLAPGNCSGESDCAVVITPFFGAAGFGLSHGVPKSTDANGNPVLPVIVAKGKIPEDYAGARFGRLFSNRELRMQVVFTPQSTWTIAGKGGKKIQGVRAKMEAILVTIGRTGEAIAVWTVR